MGILLRYSPYLLPWGQGQWGGGGWGGAVWPERGPKSILYKHSHFTYQIEGISKFSKQHFEIFLFFLENGLLAV